MEFHEGDWKRDQLALADAALEAQRKELDARKQEELTLADRSSIATSASSRDQSSEEEDDTSEDEDEESTDETEEDESEEEEESESEEEIVNLFLDDSFNNYFYVLLMSPIYLFSDASGKFTAEIENK